jgi:ankyrin repeat protein
MSSTHDYSQDPTPLITSISLEDKFKFISLLKNGENLDLQDEYGQTAIISFINQDFGDLRWLRILLKKGANVNLLDKDGDSALDLARFKNRQDIVQLLLNYGATGKDGDSMKQKYFDMYYDDCTVANFIKKISKNNNQK